ncbi:hypothetical protein TRFO_22177 [Tritrichomonas foetus]|uniref:Uncharacterized protein n=1 Tax=Tritrichomonas foetus TaxID=1144522 RepID=A0A1J4KGU6_9EUKA|nr:hypothetical protein TRFO_22177 [Tritrichomonas foetus]|eukprot:OHT09028.1 hypothetical protein TRFO_22177 [Tritrichomonas foetus]
MSNWDNYGHDRCINTYIIEDCYDIPLYTIAFFIIVACILTCFFLFSTALIDYLTAPNKANKQKVQFLIVATISYLLHLTNFFISSQFYVISCVYLFSYLIRTQIYLVVAKQAIFILGVSHVKYEKLLKIVHRCLQTGLLILLIVQIVLVFLHNPKEPEANSFITILNYVNIGYNIVAKLFFLMTSSNSFLFSKEYSFLIPERFLFLIKSSLFLTSLFTFFWLIAVMLTVDTFQIWRTYLMMNRVTKKYFRTIDISISSIFDIFTEFLILFSIHVCKIRTV